MSVSADRLEVTDLEDRYSIERHLGEGAAGAVYLVRDRETGEAFALKKLLRMDGESVLRLKREFRSLADLHHHNLVKVYDMGRARDGWFITMEYLNGCDLLSYLDVHKAADDVSVHGSLTLQRGLPANDQVAALQRLASAFQQLAQGVRALHRAGMLHRDLKPSNIMVAEERVVVLDFGLIREVGDGAATVTQDNLIAGTPAYMAPEQVRGDVLTEATDWYAFGVMLYEAISGGLPIDGQLSELLRSKLESDPPPLNVSVPARLRALCMALLDRNPSARPGFDAISEVLSDWNMEFEPTTQTETERASLPTARRELPKLFGRAEEQAQLEQAFEAVCGGAFATVHVRGPSGAGKSALVEHFLESLQLRAARDALVLRGRCYEREAMPFKALDGILEALVDHFERLDDLVVSHMLPTQLAELTRAFPVLERLQVVKRLLATQRVEGEGVKERAHAEQALRDLLVRVSGHKQLVLWIDDLQWGDLDSVTVLRSLFASTKRPPVLLLIFSYRSDELSTNACLHALNEPSPHVPAADAPLHATIDLGPLRETDVTALCRQHFGTQAATQATLIGRIVREAQGSPFLASQLLTLAQAKLEQGGAGLEALSIVDLVAQASALLPPPARELLHVLAVAGRPVNMSLALGAANIHRDGRAQLHALQSLGLTRARTVSGQRLIEVYHDRIRETVHAALTQEQRRDTHRRLLIALELSGKVDPDWLHLLAVGAGERASALHYGLLAADRALSTLAFERAAELYQQCLEHTGSAAADSGELWRKLASALARCRRGEQAARAYLEAANRAPAPEALELRRVAAVHLLRNGHFSEGEALVNQVLHDMGIDTPTSDVGLLTAVGWEQTRMKLRGFAFTPRAPESVSPRLIAEALTYGMFSVNVQSYDPVRAALFQLRGVRAALETGLPRVVVGALCTAAAMAATATSEGAATRTEALLERATHVARAVDGPLCHTRITSTRAITAFLLNQPTKAAQLSLDAEKLYLENPDVEGEMAGEYYHRFVVAATRIGALCQLGEVATAGRELQQELTLAQATGNLTAVLHLATPAGIVDIAAGEPLRAQHRLMAQRSALPPRTFGFLHMTHMTAVMRVVIATGDYAWADAVLSDLWPRFERSVLRFSTLAVLAHTGRGRMQLTRHVVEQHKVDPQAVARADIRVLRKRGVMGKISATRLLARAAYMLGDN
ncbi:MAG: hypothetical protein RL701_6506, partial [Pseudomonadota bacterium]